MDDCIRWTGDVWTFITSKVEVSRQGVEDLPAVCQVCLEGENAGVWVWEVDEVEVEYSIAAFDELWQAMSSRLS